MNDTIETTLSIEDDPPNAKVRKERPPLHPLCARLRELRIAAGLSLAQIQERHGFPAVVIASYERGDRTPPVDKLDTLLRIYNHRLSAVPANDDRDLIGSNTADLAGTLRIVADRVEHHLYGTGARR